MSGRNSLSEKPRERKEKEREKCAHVLRIAADLNQPLTRVPTHTPYGETGSEDSWLRVARGSNMLANKSPLIRHCESRISLSI